MSKQEELKARRPGLDIVKHDPLITVFEEKAWEETGYEDRNQLLEDEIESAEHEIELKFSFVKALLEEGKKDSRAKFEDHLQSRWDMIKNAPGDTPQKRLMQAITEAANQQLPEGAQSIVLGNPFNPPEVIPNS